MMTLKAGPLRDVVPGVSEPPLHWHDRQSIDGILRGNFRVEDYEGPNRLFSALFNFSDMETLAGIEFRMTNNLLDHLLVEKFPGRTFGSAVYIFHHATVLEELMVG